MMMRLHKYRRLIDGLIRTTRVYLCDVTGCQNKVKTKKTVCEDCEDAMFANIICYPLNEDV